MHEQLDRLTAVGCGVHLWQHTYLLSGHGCSSVTLLVGCSEAAGGGFWPRLVLIHACVVLQVIHDTFEVWCSVTGMAVSRVWQPPVAALPSMPVAFMLYTSDFCYTMLSMFKHELLVLQ